VPSNFDAEEFGAKLAVVGVGGQGCNLVNRLFASGIKSAKTIAVNTDAKHLNMINADKKILIGKATTRGLGAGGYPEVAAKAAQADIGELEEAIKGFDLVFVCAGMGGGTGTGALPVVAKVAREQGALVVAFVTYPFALERSRKLKANQGIEELSKFTDTTIIVQNDKILNYSPNLQMEKAFELIDSIASNAIRGISDTIMFPSLINLDLADIRAIMRNAGTAMINVGTGSGGDRVNNAIKSTISHPLLDVDTEGAKGALVHITAGTGITIEEATRIGEGVTQHLDARANVKFAARLDPDLGDQIRVMSIITGVKAKLGDNTYSSSNKLESSKSSMSSDFISI
jgi:cell division protein FtsZ